MKKRMDLHAAENRVIYLGRRGENLANTIEIDASPMRKEFPECTFLLMVQRPGESSAYSAAITMDGDVVSWPLTNADTGIAGDGCAEMRAMVGDTIAKTALFRTHIDESMNLPQEETPPAPQKGWLDQALAAQVKAEEAAQSAKNSADTVEATINAVIDKATAATSSATQAATNANSAAQTAQTVADTVQQKLDNGDFVGPAGKPGSDASVTADNIRAALGYTPVKDVRLNGESLVQDSAATIPLAGYNRLGAVQLDPAGFAAASVEGKLALVPPTDAQISTHTYTQRPITPSCMDYAVTAAMTDGKGPAWTAAQQTAARERMGIPGDYELIEEITISEAVTSFIRESTPDGTPYSLAGFLCVITSPGVDMAITLSQQIWAGETSLYNYGVRAVDAAVNSKSVLFACVNNKILHGEQYPVGAKYEFANVPRFAKKFVLDGSPITKIAFSGDIPANTKITIYGVKAQ